jgi:hypothetical protein
VIPIVSLDHLVDFLGQVPCGTPAEDPLCTGAPGSATMVEGADRAAYQAEVAAYRARYGVPGK